MRMHIRTTSLVQYVCRKTQYKWRKDLAALFLLLSLFPLILCNLFFFLLCVRVCVLQVSPLLRNARVVKVFLHHHTHAHIDFSTLTHFLPIEEGKGIIVVFTHTHTLGRPNFTLTYSRLGWLVLLETH